MKNFTFIFLINMSLCNGFILYADDQQSQKNESIRDKFTTQIQKIKETILEKSEKLVPVIDEKVDQARGHVNNMAMQLRSLVNEIRDKITNSSMKTMSFQESERQSLEQDGKDVPVKKEDSKTVLDENNNTDSDNVVKNNDVQEQSSSRYSVIDYLYKNPWTCAAVGTGVVATIGAAVLYVYWQNQNNDEQFD